MPSDFKALLGIAVISAVLLVGCSAETSQSQVNKEHREWIEAHDERLKLITEYLQTHDKHLEIHDRCLINLGVLEKKQQP